MTDAQAVKDVAKGGMRALGLLMDRYGDMVYRLALSVLCDRDEADDVAQEVFIKVWKNASRYDPAYSFSTWVCRMAYNLSIDRLRKAGRRRRADSEQYMMRGQSVPFSPVWSEGKRYSGGQGLHLPHQCRQRLCPPLSSLRWSPFYGSLWERTGWRGYSRA